MAILEVSLCLLALVAFIALHGPVQKCTTFNCSVYQSIIIYPRMGTHEQYD